jgi:hypothetical protein
MKNLGKKGLEWEKEKISLRKEFDEQGIYWCEFRGSNCTGGGDTFAHVLRRRHLGRWGTEERRFNLSNVARICVNCASYLTLLGEAVEIVVIQGIIDRRKGKFILGDL